MKFSVIIPVYNKELFIKRSLQSVLEQTYNDFEIIVVDDGSSDNSASVIKDFDDSRIFYIYKENGGVSSARNLGIANSTGEWVVFLDADDILYPNALQTYFHLIHKYPGLNVVAASADQSNKNYPKQEFDYIVRDYDYSNAVSYAKSGFSLIHTDSICIKKTLIDKVGGFNENYTHGEDMDLWKRLSDESHIAKSEIPVAFYDQDVAGNSSSVAESNRKYAPIAILEHPRSYFKKFSAKLLQGERVFFYTIPSVFKSWDKYKLKMLFKYFDWVVVFSLYVFYYRIIKSNR